MYSSLKDITHPSEITDNKELISKVLLDVDLNLLDRLYIPEEINPNMEGDIFYKFRNKWEANCHTVKRHDGSTNLQTTRDIKKKEKLMRFVSDNVLLNRYKLQTMEKKNSVEDYITNLQSMYEIDPIGIKLRIEMLGHLTSST